MDDLELTRLCAQAMGYIPMESPSSVLTVIDGSREFTYQPLHDDAQAMALLKRFEMNISGPYHRKNPETWRVVIADEICSFNAVNADLNRAIVECVAKMEASANDSD